MPPKQGPASPIAIIGMGLRLPGGISTPEDFWSLLVDKKDGRCRVPSDRYNVDAFHGDKTHRQNVATDYGYFLNTNIKAFDTSFFSVRRAEVDVTDPQLRLLLEVVWECMENAGQIKLQGSKTGVFVGVFGEDWHNMLHKDSQMPHTYRVLSAGDYALSNVLSYEYDLKGPSMTIRTACSSSLSSLHLACQALYNGDCETAIVAGSSVIIDPTMTLDMSEQGVLSPTGSCKTFDASADGFARGEAVNAILLKPLEDAIRDGDPVRAVIRSTAINSDGKTSHIGSPSSEAQVSMIRRAYEVAGIDDLSQTPFIECHGTGTVRGDPIEAAAVAEVFGDGGIYIGSVKPNVGHGEGAAALTSIIKAVLALENKTIPPNINFSNPNPKIPFEKYNLKVPIEPTAWPKDRHARISVSAFGFGGANGHVIIDSAASFGIRQPVRRLVGEAVDQLQSECTETSDQSSDETSEYTPDKTPDDTSVEYSEEPLNKPFPRLIPISASNEKSLTMRVEDLRQYMETRPGSIDDIAYTLGVRRAHLPRRTFCIAQDKVVCPLDFSPIQKSQTSTGQDAQIAYVFTGQGAQWAGMGESLVSGSPSFLKDIQEMDHALQQLPEPPQWTIEELLCSRDDTAKDWISQAVFAQPLCTAIQVAVVNFLKNCGIVPSAVVGHSSGEIAAAYTAGALTMTEAIVCAYLRGLATKRLTRTGKMAAVGMGSEIVLPYLVEGAQVACENSPESVTISGDPDAIQQTLESINDKDPDVFTRELRVNVAYHSHHMYDIGPVYEKMLIPHLSPKEMHHPFYSTVFGKATSPKMRLGPAYWRSNLESSVLFQASVQHLLDELPNATTILEIGPHSALQGPLRQCFQARGSKDALKYIPTILRDKDPAVSILSTLGQLYAQGYNVDFSFINPMASLLTDLPNYPWDHDKDFWKESRISHAWRFRKHSHHELLGSRCLEAAETEPMWRNVLYHYDVPWLADHKVGTNIVFPCAGYIAMMGEAIRQVTDTAAYVLQRLMVKSALVFTDTDTIEFITTMRPLRLSGLTNSSSWYEISISAYNGTSWAECCVAQGKAGEKEGSHQPVTEMITPHVRKVPKSYFYDRMLYIGLVYGPRFQGLNDISTHTDEKIAVGSLRNDMTEHEARYAVHPTTLDCCFQLGIAAECKGIARNLDTLALPIDIEHVTVYPGGPDLLAEANLCSTKKTASVLAIDEANNRLVVKIENGRCIPFETGDYQSTKNALHAARIEWLPDIDFLDANDLIKRNGNSTDTIIALEKIATAGILQALDVFQSLSIVAPGHLAKYASWLRNEKGVFARGERKEVVPEAEEWIPMSIESRQCLLDSLLENVDALGDPIASGVGRTLHKVAQHDNIKGIFMGEINPVQLLLEDNGLRDFYDCCSDYVSADEFLSLCAHSQPNLNVLEIGAGTGAMTAQVLKSLVSKDGARMYSQYVFTDISSGFFGPAKDRFGGWGAIEYKVLDIEKDPSEQGFELGSFDLIVASNVIHATASLHHSLTNVRSLLRPGGRLYLQELAAPVTWRSISFVTGLFPGWWLGDSDGRNESPCVSTKRWDEELRSAGFSGADTAILDHDPPHTGYTHIISTNSVKTSEDKSVIFLYNKNKHEFGLRLAGALEQEGFLVQWKKLGDADQHIEGQDVVSTIDLEDPYLHEISKQDYTTFMEYLSNLKHGVLWLTRPSQIGCTDPRYGMGIGLMRTIRIELGVDFWTVELQALDLATVAKTAAICQKFRNRPRLDSKLDAEYSVHSDTVRIGRYHWIPTSRELESHLGTHDPKQMMIGQYGLIDSLHWVQQESVDLRADEVEMEVRCVGLNFRDIMVIMGIVHDEKDSLGAEATGVVTRVGSDVHHLKVGDRVFTFFDGLFATRKVISARYVVPIADKFSFEEAATMPLVYATAIHAIIDLGQLEKGQSILIHSAAGGVGQAAINVSQMLGAEIYVTVGSEEKVQYLMEHHGIPRERIFLSRNDSFLAGIMKATGGRGVDLVLNSLSGDLLHASWQCVARSGKMMEIGKRDILERGRLALDMFQHNRVFFGIDLKELAQENPERMHSLVKRHTAFVLGNHLKPI
ncbi:hypothetical protein G7Z17_g3332 [Cylindrodendrum hubeiense]|uniref:Polyketide synthase n=1 Tax=Cylindrodendrum hubeiense TaxID=595255 RepID=A0A9P5HI41_9HYPO|nr:hypothetical protein G7Z17_g3332 [Cylindrodendrum hubeiense]